MALFEKHRRVWSGSRPTGQRRRRRAPVQGGPLALESLEIRLAPAVSTWSGAFSNVWSDAGNWDVPPAPGNDLVFPAGATNLANTNDLAAMTGFGALTIQGADYSIDGSAIALT